MRRFRLISWAIAATTHASGINHCNVEGKQFYNSPRGNRSVAILLAIIGLTIVLLTVNIGIQRYEAHLANGRTLLLELAPVDPRSLMQGDYMTLNYDLANQILDQLQTQGVEREQAMDGWAIVTIDTHRVGKLKNVIIKGKQDNTQLMQQLNHLKNNEMAIYFRQRDYQVKLASNAFFFQEGRGGVYEAAKYGLFKINAGGKPLLVDLVNADYEVILPDKSGIAETNND